MTEKRWEFELEGVKHSVELEHSPFSNKRSIRVDGRLLAMPPESQQPKERGGRHAFRVNGHPCEVVIKYENRKFDYDLIVDGIPNTPEKYALESAEVAPVSKETESSRWTVIGLFLLIGIGGKWFNWYSAHTKGYYLEELAVICPAVIVVAISFILFPKDFVTQYAKKISVRMWIVVILALLLGFANNYALGHGLY